MTKLSQKQIETKIKKTPGHSPHKLTSFEEIFEAAEHEKFDLNDLAEQAKLLDLTEDQKVKITDRLTSFEPTTAYKLMGWSKSSKSWK